MYGLCPQDLKSVQPEFGRNFNLFVNQGVFPIRLDCGYTIDKKHLSIIRIKNIRSIGKIGRTLADIPAGDRYPNLPQRRYIGNDAWGEEFATLNSLRQRKALYIIVRLRLLILTVLTDSFLVYI